MEIISLSCPNCGAPVSTRQNNCEYCQSPVIITSFTNIADMPLPQISKYADSYKKTLAENPDSQDLNLSIGICYLRLKMYEKASASFEKAMEDNFDNPEPFFWVGFCEKKTVCHSPPVITKIKEYLNSHLHLVSLTKKKSRKKAREKRKKSGGRRPPCGRELSGEREAFRKSRRVIIVLFPLFAYYNVQRPARHSSVLRALTDA